MEIEISRDFELWEIANLIGTMSEAREMCCEVLRDWNLQSRDYDMILECIPTGEIVRYLSESVRYLSESEHIQCTQTSKSNDPMARG